MNFDKFYNLLWISMKYYYFSPKGATRLMKLEILIFAFGDTSNEMLKISPAALPGFGHTSNETFTTCSQTHAADGS